MAVVNGMVMVIMVAVVPGVAVSFDWQFTFITEFKILIRPTVDFYRYSLQSILIPIPTSKDIHQQRVEPGNTDKFFTPILPLRTHALAPQAAERARIQRPRDRHDGREN